MKFQSLLTALVLANACPVQAAAVVYDFQDFFGNPFAPALVPAHLQASALRFESTSGSNYLCTGEIVAAPADYFCGGFGNSTVSFVVNVEAGWRFDINSFVFQGLGVYDNTGTAPTDFAVYSSLDGFLNPLISGSLVGQVAMQRYDYDAGLSAQGLTGPFELRLVSTGHSGEWASAWLVDNLRLDVTVTEVGSVSEPGSAALALLALLALPACRAARRTKG